MSMNEYDDDMIEEMVKYFEDTCTEQAKFIWDRKYLLRNPDCPEEVTETIGNALKRVAFAIASVEAKYSVDEQCARDKVSYWYRHFVHMMCSREGTPAGRTLANAGNVHTHLVPNCVVLHINDSLDDIFKTLWDAAKLQQRGSGIGYPLHLLRPAYEPVKKSMSRSSGPLSWLRVYNTAFGQIKQQNRHGANMAIMRVDHPDILEFINCKRNEGDISNFNISVALTDEFMRQVKDDAFQDTPWKCHFNGKEYGVREITRNASFTHVESIEDTGMTARQLFAEIVDAAWTNGEPGVAFVDTVNKSNPLPRLGRIEACNPCGEQFLQDGDICNLGHVNAVKHVTANGELNIDKLKHTTQTLTRMLDNVIDAIELSDVERVADAVSKNRRIGIGVFGVADMLYEMRLGYNSKEAVATCELLMKTIQDAAEEMSERLAEERGVFPNYEHSVFSDRGVKRRNAALTSVAPCGTTSQAFDANGGMEPKFSLKYYRTVGGQHVGKVLTFCDKQFLDACEDAGIEDTHSVVQRVLETGSTACIDARSMREEPCLEKLKRVFVVAEDLTPEEHINMQAAFQRHCDNSISKTINFPNSATRDDVHDAYFRAWESGCKGCTIYRDGSRVFQILSSKSTAAASEDEECDHKKEDVSLAGSSSSEDDEVVSVHTTTLAKQKCPDCNSKDIKHSEGCMECRVCKWSACGTPLRV